MNHSETAKTKKLPRVVASHKKHPKKRKKRKGKKRFPRPTKTVHKKWKKVDGALQENILTLLCFDTESCKKIIAAVPVQLFETTVYRTIAERAVHHFKKYQQAAGEHLPDVLEDLLTSSKRSDSRMYTDALNELHSLYEGINKKYVMDELYGFVRQQRLIQLTTTAAGELQRGNTAAFYNMMTKGLERIGNSDAAGSGPLAKIRTAQELRKAEFPKLGSIVDPILQDPGILLALGPFGSGKTLTFMGLANAISAGEDFLDFLIDEPRSVLYMDAELPGNALQQRDKMIGPRGKRADARELSFWSAADCYPAPMPNLADLAQIDPLIEACDPYDVVFVDPISAMTRGVDMNTAEAWEGPLQFAMRRRHAGKSTVILQHVGKDKSRGPRGSSRQEDFVDTSLMLEKVSGANGDSAVKMTCRKLRNHPESDFTPINIEFVNDGDKLRFKHQTLQASKSELVAKEYRRLLEKEEVERGTQSALAKDFKLNKGTVSKIASRVARKFHKEKK